MPLIKFTPVTLKRLRRFKSIKRGYFSLIILCSVIFLSFFAEFIMNSRAIMVIHEGSVYFPTFKFYPGTTFGLENESETNYRELKKEFKKRGKGFILMPLVPYNPYEYDFSTGAPPPNSPSKTHWFGTDDRGRDILVRLFYGFRIAILFALMLTICGYLIGVSIGAIMGYFGGWVDLLLQRFIEMWSATPFLYLCIIISSLLTPNIYILFFILLLFSWIGMTYYARTEIYREKSKDYCYAARSIGAGHLRVIFRHLLPNSLVPVISFFPFAVVGSIGSLTSLDYLGYGLPPPTPSWGELLSQGGEHLHNAYWIILSTFAALACTLLLVTFIGEAIREAFDPKQYSKYQ